MSFDFKIIPPLEKYPALVRFAETLAGRLVLVAAFSGLLVLTGSDHWMLLGGALALISILPKYRRPLVALATFVWLEHVPPFDRELDWLSHFYHVEEWFDYRFFAVAVFFLAVIVLIGWAREKPDHPLFHRPVRNLLLGYAGALFLTSWFPLPLIGRVVLWTLLVIAGKYLWFMSYSLADRRAPNRPPVAMQVFTFQPFWGSTNVPYPKGEANLSRIEAKNETELAISLLKGIKLMVWILFLSCVYSVFRQAVYGVPGPVNSWLAGQSWHGHVPTLRDAIGGYLAGKPASRLLVWMSIIANFCDKLLSLTCSGGVIIATCRMSGFNALRNTYKPLSSASIAEFYNRVYFYFKELLADFFFFPAYFRFFKKQPRLRIFFATLAAAGFGNFLYHFLRDITVIIQIGFWRALLIFHVYFIYAMILGIAIGLSQMRALDRPVRRGFWNSVVVLSFYCLLSVIDDPHRGWTIVDYGSFMLNLFIPFKR